MKVRLEGNPAGEKQNTLRCARNILVIGTFLVLYTTLFPFDFTVPGHLEAADIFGSFDFSLRETYVFANFPQNVLLFIPFGFGLAAVRSRKRINRVFDVGTVFLAGGLFSASIEVAQVFLLRFPATADILANSLGALIGALLLDRWGLKILNWQAGLHRLLDRRLTGLPLVLILAGYLGFLLIFSHSLHEAVSLSNWDLSYPLLIGNEATGDRPWRGTVSQLYIADFAFSDEQARFALERGAPPDDLARRLLAYYPLEGPAGMEDRAGNSPDLNWQGIQKGKQNGDGITTGEDAWLVTSRPAEALSRRIAGSEAFTIGLTVKPERVDQSGPARIVSVSRDPFHRNITIGQEGEDLIVRLRNRWSGESAVRPELITPEVFQDTTPHRLLFILKDSHLQVFVDRIDNDYSFHYSPAFMLFWSISPAAIYQIRINTFSQGILTFLYVCLVLIPFFWAAGRFALKSRHFRVRLNQST